jgi:DNA helicase-2/ATP-dependent DNA helicase PcrA
MKTEVSSLDILSHLNPPQREAVMHTEGPLLIFAGAGSGKTRVLTHRIAYLIAEKRVNPAHILAVTFTNKAANEMKERVERLVGVSAERMWIGTFHAMCARLLRMHGERIGIDRNFVIFDEDDSTRLVRDCLRELDIDPERYRPASVKSAISAAKNELIDPRRFQQTRQGPWDKMVARVYARYQERLHQNRALDFDDLLMRAVELLRESEETSAYYQERFRYILVDEFQDVNYSQYRLVELLARRHRNICVVGDDDQCLVKGTPILTPRGYKPIESLKADDKVISALGQDDKTTVARVGKVMVNCYSGKVLRITTINGEEVVVTPNHVMFARPYNRRLWLFDRRAGEPYVGLRLFGGDREDRDWAEHIIYAGAAYGKSPDSDFWGCRDYDEAIQLAKRLQVKYDAKKIDVEVLFANDYRPLPASELSRDKELPVISEQRIVGTSKIQAITPEYYEGKVYDLSVPNLRNYIANGIVVHNSIYSWRGADVRLILEFESDYPDAKIIKLEQNYRSTQPILDAAWHVIRHNLRRADKRLWTEKKEGTPVIVHDTANEQEEAFWVAEKIQELRRGGRKLSDFAILCRVNAQSRIFEEVFTKLRLPLQLVGTQRFYERKEIKDVVAYLKLLFNPYDEISLRRVINVPPRGIGDKTISRLEEVSTQSDKSLMDVLRNDDLDVILDRRAASAVKRFRDLLVNLQQQAEHLTVSELVTMILDKTGYHEWLREERTIEAAERLENLDELLTAARQFDENYQLAVSREPLAEDDSTRNNTERLASFLEQTSLSSDLDKYAEDSDRVTMMTLHSAKGLEFGVVFLVGMEQGLLPHARAVFNDNADPRELEEERRLCYVGITRAQEQVFLTYAHRRTLHGRNEPTMPSQFLNEIPSNLTAKRDRAARREPSPPSSPAPSLDLTKILSKPRQPAVTQTISLRYKIGDKVRHGVWGEGIVVKVAPDGAEPFWIEVAFPRSDVGIKKIAPQYAPLERI